MADENKAFNALCKYADDILARRKQTPEPQPEHLDDLSLETHRRYCRYCGTPMPSTGQCHAICTVAFGCEPGEWY